MSYHCPYIYNNDYRIEDHTKSPDYSPKIVNEYFIVVGGNTIRPYSQYNISVTTYGNVSNVLMKVGIKSSNLDYDDHQVIETKPYKTQNVSLNIEKLSDKSYYLYAEALNGFDNIKKEEELKLNLKDVKIFVQKDKPIYKPGDCIKFRVLFLDSNLKMCQMKRNINIFFTDPNKNLLKQWKNIELVKGVFTSEYQLSTNPYLGTWRIKVTVDEEIIEKNYFKVAEYILPTFYVNINTEPNICIHDDIILVCVTANYTNGKPVIGELTINTEYHNLNDSSNSFINKKISFSGKHYQQYSLKNLKINNLDSYITIEVTVTEKLTNKQVNANTRINLKKKRYDIIVQWNSEHLKPGLSLYGKVYVKNINGSPPPISADGNFVTLKYDDDFGNQENFLNMIELNQMGVGNIELKKIPSSVRYLKFNLTYLDSKKTVGICLPFEKKCYIQVNPLTENYKINDEIECEVKASEKIKYFSYQIIARGNIIYSGTKLIRNGKQGKFKFLSTFDMVPKCTIFVYVYQENGEFILDTINLEFPLAFQNKIEIKLDKTNVKPGDNINLIINTTKDSFVGLLGIDESLLLLKPESDLNPNQIFKTLNNGNYNYNMNYKEKEEVYQIKKSGMIFLTNIEFAPRHMFHLQYGGGGFLESDIVIRKKFPETWIFDNIVDCGERMILSKKVPDTITSWIISGFSIDPVMGFGMTEQPNKLKVFQPFFLSLNLPYSIKCGEYIEIQILIFNYTNNDLFPDVTFDNRKDEFDIKGNTEEMKFITKTVEVLSNNFNSIKFMIRAKSPGYKTIKVIAVTLNVGDAIEKNLLVEPAGITKYQNQAFLIDLREKREFTENLCLNIPKKIIPDSFRIDISIIGDVLGSVSNNLDNLIKLPHGCGEQNMLNFVPNIVILNYLTSINKLTEPIKQKAIKYLTLGYQQELTYAHSNGSFSAFGKMDKAGSTWLTAFVVKSFQQASKYIDIDKKVIANALKWLCEQQSENGSFIENGTVFYKEMQGGGASGICLTSYVLTAFLQSEVISTLYQKNIEKGFDFILKNISDKAEDIYSLVVTTYAMHLSKHSKSQEFLEKIKSKAISTREQLYWEHPSYKRKPNGTLYDEPNCINVELTSYALLSYIESNLITDAIPVMNWLITQRNKEGGFSSTQDTIMGIEALSKIACHINSNKINMKLLAEHNNDITIIDINPENANVLQSHELPSSIRKIKISALGIGMAVGQISYKYNIVQTNRAPSFNLNVKSKKKSENLIDLLIKVSYMSNRYKNDLKSNMAVMEIKFPSGYVFEKDTLDELKKFNFIKKIETKDMDTIVILYFDNLDANEIAINVCGYREHVVEEKKPVPIIIYDYYDNNRRAIKFYNI